MMAMAQENLLNGQGVFIKLQEVGNQSLSTSGIEQIIPSLRFQVGGKPVLPYPSFYRDRVFTNDRDPCFHNSSKTSQLTLGDFDFHLIEKISHLLHGNFIFAGYFLSQGTGNFSIFGCFFQLGGNFFLFQDPILLWRVPSPLLREKGDGGENS
jgi:hypothetical protein